MARLRRLGTVVLVLFGALLFAPMVARADCSIPTDPTFPCSPPPPGPSSTPKPTATPVKTPTPTKAPAPAPQPVHHTSVSTPAVTPFPVEVDTTAQPGTTPEIVVQGPVDGGQAPLDVQNTASASSWIFGFIVGFIIGGLAGRASWGLRKRRRQQIFG
jgi:hypothetical protein